MSITTPNTFATSPNGRSAEAVAELKRRVAVLERGGGLSGGGGGGVGNLSGDTTGPSSSNLVTKATGHFPIKGPRPWVDVTHPDYGADTTGTNDCKAAFQAAIDAVTALGGGTVVVPGAGNIYRFITPPALKSNVTLLGIGNPVIAYHASAVSTASLLVTNTSSIPGTDCSETGVYGQTNVAVKGIVFDGELRTSSAFLTTFHCTDTVTVEDCEFRNIYNGCLACWGSNDVTFRKLRFRSWGLAGYPSIGGAALNLFGSQGSTTQTGTISSSGTTVTGSGTSFTSGLIGKYIGADLNRVRKVTAVASATSLTVESAFITNLSAGTAWKLVDVTPTSGVRGSDLHFQDGRWHPIINCARDFIFQRIVINGCMESGMYGNGYGGTNEDYPPHHAVTRDGVIDGFRATNVRRQHVASAGLELGGENIRISNAIVNDTDGPGLQINWPSDQVSATGCQFWDTLVRRVITAASWSGGTATYTSAGHGFQTGKIVNVSGVVSSGPGNYNGQLTVTQIDADHFSASIATDPGTYSSGGRVIYYTHPNYGQVTLLQRDASIFTAATDFEMENIKVNHSIIGKWGVTPEPPYAIRLDGFGSEVMHNIDINDNDLRWGYLTQATSTSPASCAPSATPVGGTDYVSRKVYSDNENIEVSLRTLGLGKTAAYDVYANDPAGVSVRGWFRASGVGAGLIDIGSVTAHVVQLKYNNASVLQLDTAIRARQSLVMDDAKDIAFSTTTGTKIGQSSTQKMSLWGKTPIVRPAAIADPSGGATVDANCRATVVSILTFLRNWGALP